MKERKSAVSKKWLFSLGSLGLIVAVLAAVTFAVFSPRSAARAAGPQLPHVGKLSARYAVDNLGSQTGAIANSGGGSSTIPTWSSAFTYNGVNYPYTMVGTNPSDGSVTTTVPTEIIPIDLSFSSGIALDGTKKVGPTIASPIFRNAQFTSGNTQYGDAIQRQEFWTYVSTVSHQYHVLLGHPTVYPTLSVNVPANKGQVVLTSTGVEVGLVDYNWWGVKILSWINQLGIQPNTLPIFLTYNTVLYIGSTSNCCVIGFHGVTRAFHTKQTFSWASWTDPGIFSVPIQDVNALSHEVAEWYNDPYTNNIVPNWSVPSEPQYGCSNLLEVGDPLVGVAFNVNGYTLQDEASYSWFAHQVPSLNQNGEYSYLGTFTSPAPGC
jgi:hypothetical protein